MKQTAMRWLNRIANVGFIIAGLYCVYLLGTLLWAAKKNMEFEGETLGVYAIERFVDGRTEPFTLDIGGNSGPNSKAVVLWATWCGPCHALLDDLKEQAAAGKLDAGRVLAISVGEPVSDVAAFLREFPLPFEVALDQHGVVAKRLRLSGTPTVALIEGDGSIRSVSTGGFRLSSKIVEFLRAQKAP